MFEKTMSSAKRLRNASILAAAMMTATPPAQAEETHLRYFTQDRNITEMNTQTPPKKGLEKIIKEGSITHSDKQQGYPPRDSQVVDISIDYTENG